MGTVIRGWIEARHPWEAPWFGVAPIRQLAPRNYWAFATLFGVPNALEELGPLAPDRGLPLDVSDRAKADYEAAMTRWPDEFFGATWITWDEIAAVDWRAPVGNLVLTTNTEPEYHPGWFTWWTSTATFTGPFPRGFTGQGGDLRPGQTWTAKDERAPEKAYRVVEGTREDLLGADWVLLFRLLEALAGRYGAETVRLVVWFDS